jgi:hypothetical protein
MGTVALARFFRIGVSCLACGALAAACGTASSTTTDTPPASCPELINDTLIPAATAPDGASACPTGACNYQTQEGCSDTQACRPSFNATDPGVNPGCDMAGSGKSGDDCTTQQQCARGYYCATSRDQKCHKLCCGHDWTACDAGESCIVDVNVDAGKKPTSAGVGLCFPVNDCDPLDPFHCADTTRECKIVDPVGNVACESKSSAKAGAPCAPPTVCAGGLSCVGGVCIPLCRFTQCGDPACPDDATRCIHFARDPDGVGECTVR